MHWERRLEEILPDEDEKFVLVPHENEEELATQLAAYLQQASELLAADSDKIRRACLEEERRRAP